MDSKYNIQPIMMWTPKSRPAPTSELDEAARQRDEIRKQMDQFEREKAEKEKLAELLKKYGKV